MAADLIVVVLAAGAAAWLFRWLQARLSLSRAKHPSLAGHARIARRLARAIPYYEYDQEQALACDGAPPELVLRRRKALGELSRQLVESAPATRAATRALEAHVSDLQFVDRNRVPFQFRSLARRHLPLGALADATSGPRIRNPDGSWSWDVGGSYGVNLLGHEWYKANIAVALRAMQEFGPVLGPYHPVIADNVRMIRELSGQDEVSFHMSGTEAVMQAVRLARYNTGRRQLVMFCGAYHGWWDGAQAGIGHNRTVDDIYLLADMSERSLAVLQARRDIACVLINPLQALHPNAAASSDAMLVASDRRAGLDLEAYSRWLRRIRETCSARGIALIFDEVFVGFRLGAGGAQDYFGVRADLVTYGKTIGGGLPVGVVAGKHEYMKRYRDDRPADLCFARGTFNAHPYVMAAMHGFLRHAGTPEFRQASAEQDIAWNGRARDINRRFAEDALPLAVHNLASVWTLTFAQPSRFNWLLQYYLRSEGLSLSWVGTGRFIFSHDYTDDDFAAVADRILAAARRMKDGGWWSDAPELSNAGIRKQVMRELSREFLAQHFRHRPGDSGTGSFTPDSPEPMP